MSATLEVHDLKRVIGDRTILTDISFSVRAGETLFIRGPSGVGKSLLLRALAYLDPIQVHCNQLGHQQQAAGFPAETFVVCWHPMMHDASDALWNLANATLQCAQYLLTCRSPAI